MLAGRSDAQMLLVASDGVPDATAAELERLAPTEVIVVGGTTAVDDAVLAAVEGTTGVAPRRIAGPDRFSTAAAVAPSETVLVGGTEAVDDEVLAGLAP